MLCFQPGFAADRASGSGVLGVILQARGADPAFREVLAGSFTVQLTRKKADLRFLAPSEEPRFTVSSALSTAASQNAEYLLVGTYWTSATECRVEVDLYEVASGEKVRSELAQGRIDLSLGSVVARAIEKAFAGIVFHGRATGSPEAAATVPVVPVSAKPIAPAGGVLPGPMTEPVRAVTVGSPPGRRLLGFSTGVAPMILTGSASDYAKLGLIATAAVDLRFPLAGGTLGAGILGGACWLSATGAVSTADVLIFPAGIDLQYLLNEGAFPGIALQLSGGPALMKVASAYGVDDSKLVPYALAGMTLDLPFAPFVGLALEARYLVFYESSLPIMAFSPEASLYVRF